MKVRVALAQIEPALGLVDKNLDLHMDCIQSARSAGVDILVFPELSLTGYLLKDLVPGLSRRRNDPLFGPLLEASRDLDLAVGFVEESEDFRNFNSLGYFSQGRLVHVHRKVYLPTYGMFEEQRFFACGEALRAFPTRFGPIAMAICEDLWHPSVPYLSFLDGALGLLVGSASPVRGMIRHEEGNLPTNQDLWLDLLRHYAALYAGFVAFCNRSGVEDGTSFWGGSRLIGPEGEAVATGPLHEPALVMGEIDLKALRRRRLGFSMLRDERPEVTLRGLERILRDRAAGGAKEAAE